MEVAAYGRCPLWFALPAVLCCSGLCPGLMPSTVGWVLPHQSSAKKMPNRLVYKLSRPASGARSEQRLGPRGGQPWAGAAGGLCRFRERLSNSSPLRGATWAAPRAWRVASRRGGHRLVSVPRFAFLSLPMLDWLSGSALRRPQASPLWDEDLAPSCLGHTRRRLGRGKVVRGVTFYPHPGNQSSIGFAEFEIRAALDIPATPSLCALTPVG